MPTDETISVSPYLLRPLRSYEQALRDRAELRSLRERAIRGVRHQLSTLQPQLHARTPENPPITAS